MNRSSNSGAQASKARAAALRPDGDILGPDCQADGCRRPVQLYALLKLAPCGVIGSAALYFLVEYIAHAAVKGVIEGPLEEHRQVTGIRPVALPSMLRANPVIEDSSW